MTTPQAGTAVSSKCILALAMALCASHLLDAEEVETVVVGDEVDGQTQVPVATGAADAVQVGLSRLGEVEVDHHVHGLDVDASREQIYDNRSTMTE